MANYSGRIVHATLTANTVDVITLDIDYKSVEIVSRDGAGEIYVTVDTSVVPTVAGLNCDVLPAAVSSITLDATGYASPTIVRLISSSAVAYSVKGLL